MEAEQPQQPQQQTKKRGRKIKNSVKLADIYPTNQNDDELTKKRKEKVAGYVKENKSIQDKIKIKDIEKKLIEEGKTVLTSVHFPQLDKLI